MGDGLRSVRLVTTDESLLASARAAVSALEGWEFDNPRTIDELVARPPVAGDVILLDGALRSRNVYEACRQLTGLTRCRTFVVVEGTNGLAEPIAHFCGATGTLTRPLTSAGLRKALDASGGPRPELPQASREKKPKAGERELPEVLLRAITGEVDARLRQAWTDPDTGLFNFAFLQFKLDEEFKRATRFSQPLSCVMLGFEGQAADQVLKELSGIILQASRDTDVLGRFDENSFLFLLPNTGPDGAQVMARRVGQMAQEQNLRDLVGDPLQIAVGIAFHPHADVKKREQLFAGARHAFLAARQKGGGVVTAS
jgi:diguanylate cyclase (GGDEF)-like protein